MAISQPDWFDPPRHIRLPASRIERSALGDDFAVVVEEDGKEHSAVVPSSAVDEERGIVHALQVGRLGNRVLITFPTSSMGTSSFSIDSDSAHRFEMM